MTPRSPQGLARSRRTGSTRKSLSLLLALAMTALLAGVTSVVLPGTASAHASLENTSPAIGAELAEAPTSIVLVFNEDIRDFAPQLAITVGDQTPVTVTPVVEVDTVTADLTGVDIPRDPNSALWKVGFRVVSDDGHPIAGVMEFSVLDNGAAAGSGSGQSNGPNENFETGGVETTQGDAETSAEPTMTVTTAPTTEGAGAAGPGATATDGTGPDEAAQPAENGGHDTGSMVAWFIGGGVLILAIIVVAVVAARRRPAAAGTTEAGSTEAGSTKTEGRGD